MDIKSEVQIKDEFLESSEDFQQEVQSFEQDLGLEEVQNEVLCTNVDVKEESFWILKKNVPRMINLLRRFLY
ncbi:hypothetical protein Avbf_14248 [Armadillidium vulgare]|nr:hypothetical protein Avbf_14248 [Armadillidium vulgare]